jgi:hypothetical protein
VKNIKMLGLAAMAALAAMAFIGVASASATEICANNTPLSGTTTACAGNASFWKYGTDLSASDTVTGRSSNSVLVASSGGTLSCTGSTLKGGSTVAGSGSVTSDTWTGCSSTVSGCGSPITAAGQSFPWGLTVSKVTGQLWDATMTVSNPNVKVTCNGGFPVCTFTATSIVGRVYNPGNANSPDSTKSIVHFPGVTLSGSGFGCPTSGTFTADYALTADNTSGGTALLYVF